MAETTVRVATYNTELARKGPGLLLRDILSETDLQVEAVAKVIARAKPDIIALQGIDYDYRLAALSALRARIQHYGHHMPYMFAARPNTGLATGLDLDGDGRLGRPRDAQGYGEFAGQGGIAVLSRFVILEEDVQDFSEILWRDIPGAQLRLENGTPLLSEEAGDVQRLSTVGHWDVPIQIKEATLHLLTFHASPPVFDGPEDRNGRRNHDEIMFWLDYLDGLFGDPPEAPFVLTGDANLDPIDAEGRKEAIRSVLSDVRFIDTEPKRAGFVEQGEAHVGDPRLDTVDWPAPQPGSLRVSYVLPSSQLKVLDSAVVAKADDADIRLASRHKLVWVDLLVK